ncbi:citramalate synthase [Allorhizocola rhizosphaerae]|uniref:citramalate synthase n=1 Tax=Allorhizocola rhizosphaerae TaxID=1872709 RepID=UPI000E3E1376|nr:citramalate synthase [Allorhizocola rhizosphaerae]
MPASEFQLYDTTLRDGTQQEGLVLSVGDKLAVARRLDEFGVTFIEGGWPGAIPRDTEFFRRAKTELVLKNAQLVAFGATRRPDVAVHHDPQVAALLEAETPFVTLVAKADSRHVELALRTTNTENLAMIRDTVRHLVRQGRRVFVDAEHYFDGFRTDRAYALSVVDTAMEAGAEVVVLCDTNGGTLPHELTSIVDTTRLASHRLGIHCHDDSGCAVANTLMAVDAGVTHVQATAHGYGERCGNANLFTVAANLVLKRGLPVIAHSQLATLSEVAQAITDITSMPAHRSAPYVGAAAFAHKAGLHTSAIRVDPSLYQHIEPAMVGNTRRTLVSDMAGRASIEMKARELGYELAPEAVARVATRVKELESQGYVFEAATASFELLVRAETGADRPFDVDGWQVTVGDAVVEATVEVDGAITRASGQTAIEALWRALAAARPEIGAWRLDHCQTWTLEGTLGIRATVTLKDGDNRCSTVGVDTDGVTATWRALQDAVRFVLTTPGV